MTELIHDLSSKLLQFLNCLKSSGVIEDFIFSIETATDISLSFVRKLNEFLVWFSKYLENWKPVEAEIRNVIPKLVLSKKEGVDDDCSSVFSVSSEYPEDLSKSELTDVEFIKFESEIFSCDDCGETFDKKELQILHTDLHKKQHDALVNKSTELLRTTPPPVTPEVDTSIVSTPDVVKKDIKQKKNSLIYTCSLCDKSFSMKNKFLRHSTSHNAPFQCTLCSKTYTRSDNLKRHLELKHSDKVQSFPCQYCEKTFSLKFNKEIHEKGHQVDVNSPIQCELCAKKFKNDLTFKSHMKIHGSHKLPCILCNKTFVRKISYKTHMKNKHPNYSPVQKLIESIVISDEQID